jgi:hypothetical protein
MWIDALVEVPSQQDTYAGEPGLFTPNASQHFRDEQRRRRSQYDRGTRLAALEEYDYEGSAVATLHGANGICLVCYLVAKQAAHSRRIA